MIEGAVDSSFGRFGSQTGGFGSHSSNDLSQYMSESERLAREQSQNVQGTGTYHGSALVDSAAHDANLAGGVSGSGGLSGGNGNGAYTKTKSWENSSKWASGTQVRLS